MPSPTVFISYSHKDEVWKDHLVTHLGVLEEEGLLQTWNDRNIGAGDEWFEEIQKAMDAARVAVLLVSANSLTSKFIRHKEIPHLLERRTREGMVFFPVIVKDCAWKKLPWLAKFQARPLDGKALAGFQGNKRDSALTKIAEEILGLIERGPQPVGTAPPVSTQGAAPLRPLHQLPSPPLDFTGRQEDLDFLKEKLSSGGTAAIFGLRGMGGVGKTTLALKLAEQLTPLYPDAQIYLDLKGVDPQPLTAAQAMAHVIRSYHPDASLPEAEAELAPLYRSVLHGQRALLLMDNAPRQADQVLPLIPPASSLLLVTSRFHFALPGLVARDLDELSPEDARDLLLRIALRIGDHADEIAYLCGRLPLALRLAGSALAERPYLSPAEYARRLKEGKERFAEVDAALNLSYSLLNEDHRMLWRILAVFPGTFRLVSAAALWELEIDQAEKAIGELTGYSLIEWEEKEERFRLHDLARDFAQRSSVSEERMAAQKRHARHFLLVLSLADDLYRKGGHETLKGLWLFDVEWENIKAGQVWAATHPEDQEATEICRGYPNVGAYVLALRLPARQQLRWREAALEVARRQGDRNAEGGHLGNLGLAYVALGEPRRAIELHEQHLAIVREIGDRHGEGQTLGNLGLAYAALGEPRRAIELHEQSLAIAREIGDRLGEGNALNNLGNAYADLGEPRRAIELYEQDLAIAREIGDRRGEGQTLGNLGIAYAILGETRRAIELYEQRLSTAREIGDRHGEGTALANLGVAYADLGETRRAIELLEQRLAIAREIGDRRGEARASWNLGVRYEAEGELSRAAALMQVCVDYELEIGHSDAETDAAVVESIRARIREQG